MVNDGCNSDGALTLSLAWLDPRPHFEDVPRHLARHVADLDQRGGERQTREGLGACLATWRGVVSTMSLGVP